ncbi:outer membrane beta-barrel protein [Pseudoflavitalea sp. X16]|uniref:outer membrane beta-barrel protein n=1 Tax=Paraflavitalea devenefica TaxID=2716334 RepID=UPI00142122E1|nr:outer membrane beta-barrel protein [Paraflavitalea devenefica]NII24748.1 outer membrane beta-barrel protein [Paraflavitalea devenefica]
MRSILLTICFFTAVTKLAAQDKGAIKGKLVDSSGKQALSLATITVFQAKDTSIITYRLSDPQGEFRVPGLPLNIPCRTVISFSGYRVVRKEFELTAAQPQLDLGTFKLIPDAQSLEEVLVTAERPPVSVKKDTIEFNATAFKTLPTALVEDLLKKLPGVDVDKDGNITVNGRTVNRILVDGKDFFGGDPKVATRNLPANIIDKVQVADDKEQLDQDPFINKAQLGQVINLKLKKSIKQGWFGKAYAGAGTDERYEAGGIINMFRDTLQVSMLGYTNNINRAGFGISDIMQTGGFQRTGVNSVAINSDGGFALNGISFGGMGQGITRSTGAGLNLNNEFGKKVTLNLQYFYGQVNNRLDQLSNTQQFFRDTIFTTRNTTRQESDEYSHRIGSNLRWKIDSFSSLRFAPQVNIKKNLSDRTQFSTSANNYESLLNESNNSQRVEGNDIGYSHSLNYSRNFRKKDRLLTIGHGFTIYNASNNQFNDITDSFYKAPTSKRTVNQLRDQDADNFRASLSVNYSEPLTKTLQLRLSGNTEYFKDEDVLTTYNKGTSGEEYDVINPDLSNGVKRKGMRGTATSSLNWKIKKLTIGTGISFQTLNIDNEFAKNPTINQRFNYLLPTLNASFKEWYFNYDVSVREPQATDLQPVVDNTNTLYQQLGNPSLVPTQSHNFNLRYNKYNTKSNMNYFIYLSGSIDRDAVIRERTVDDKGVQMTRPVNADGIWRFMASTNISKQFKFNSSWQLSLRGSFAANYNRNLVIVNSNRSEVKNWRLMPGLNGSFNLKDKLELNQRYNITWNKSLYESNAFTDLEVVTHNSSSEVIIRLPKHFVWESSIDYSYNPQTAPGVRKSNLRWNAGINYLFLKDDKGQLKLSVYDLLNQNTSVSRTTRENYIQDNQTTVLQRYFLLTFTYNIRKFGAPRTDQKFGKNGLFIF